MAKNDGGPAYPAKVVKENIRGDKRIERRLGMSLRDWFAGQALAAIIEADGIQFACNSKEHADHAYAHADAMLAEREKGGAK